MDKLLTANPMKHLRTQLAPSLRSFAFTTIGIASLTTITRAPWGSLESCLALGNICLIGMYLIRAKTTPEQPKAEPPPVEHVQAVQMFYGGTLEDLEAAICQVAHNHRRECKHASCDFIPSTLANLAIGMGASKRDIARVPACVAEIELERIQFEETCTGK